MSIGDTTTNGTPMRHVSPAPAPEPLTGLTGAHAAIYTELSGLAEPVTVAEPALAAGVGMSTAGRAVAALEKRGLAARTPGGHTGSLRNPDLWYPANPATETASTEGDEKPTKAQPESSATDAEEPGDSNTQNGDNSPDEADPDTPTTGPQQHHPRPRRTGAPQMVIDHLRAHPDEAFTTTRISRIIEKSSGAIAIALVKLVKLGIAEQVSDQPRTFRLTNATPTGNTQ